MRSVAKWIDPRPADPVELALILHCKPDAPIIARAQQAIRRGAGFLGAPAHQGVKELRENLDSLRAALDRMQRTVRFMEGEDHFLDEHYLHVSGDHYLMELRQRTGASSGFSAVLERMAQAVDDCASESAQEARQGRNEDGSHTLAIAELIHFARAEGIKVTHTRGSIFPRLVALAYFTPDSTRTAAIKRAIEATT